MADVSFSGELASPLAAFQRGFSIVLFHLIASSSTIFKQRRVKSLLIGFLITLIVVYIITLPIRLLLYIIEVSLSALTMSNASKAIRVSRLNITFASIFGDIFWYIPLLILFISRTFGLFTNEPFEEQLMDQNESFCVRLSNAECEQTLWSSFKSLSVKVGQLLLVSTALFLLKLIPGLRLFVSLAILGFQLYKKIFRVNFHINNMALTVIAVAVTMLFSNWLTKWVLYVFEFYLTSLALSREFLEPYFSKVSRKMEKKDIQMNQWLLFGFGSAITIAFAIPFVGLVAYPIFQRAAADVLMVMFNQKMLTFEKHDL